MMILIKKNNTRDNHNKLGRIYINTLVPYFKFKNNKGSVITPISCCIAL